MLSAAFGWSSNEASPDIFVAFFPGLMLQSRRTRSQSIAMNAYLFTAGLTQAQVRPTPGRGGQMVDSLRVWDSCMSAIIYGGDPEQAQKRFEAWCRRTPEGENPSRRKSKRSAVK